ncbi:MAG: hypothetical protein JJU20_08495 [Opitutales bacterium]|nr:hypothetical protein [Opitutales bacterium]
MPPVEAASLSKSIRQTSEANSGTEKGRRLTEPFGNAKYCLPPSEISFITDCKGIIKNYNRAEAASLRMPRKDLTGENLRKCLTEIKPHWQDPLAGPFVHLEKLLLPWSPDPASASAMEWQLLRHEDLCFVTLSPVHSLVLDDDKRWSNFLKHFSGVCYRQRADLSFRSISPNAESLLGLTMNNLLQSGASFLNCIHPVDLNRLLNRLGNINPDTDDIVTWQYRFRNPRTQKLHYLTDVREPLFSAEGTFMGYEGILVDVTRQAVAEKRLSNASWQQNLSTLISGMAHDFGNIMTGVYSYSDSIQHLVEEDSDIAKGLKNITQYASEANQLIRRMVDISRNQGHHKGLHNLDSLLGEQADLIKIILGRRFSLQLEKPNRELPVYIDDFGFRQMILNFASNSRDAISGEAEIQIFLQALNRNELLKAPGMDYGASEEWVELIFADSGPGVSSEMTEKLFDPFYSTKDPAKGSGLGLYNARIYCEEHGGTIQIESGKSNGFQIVIHLPLLDEEAVMQILNRRHDLATVEVPGLIYVTEGKHQDSGLIQQMLDHKWKIHQIRVIDDLNNDRLPRQPDLLVIDYWTLAKLESDFLNALHSHYPETQKVLNLFGVNPDEVDNQVTARFDMVINGEPSSLNKYNTLERFWKEQKKSHA